MKKAIVILLVLVTALCLSAVACKKQPCKDGEHVFVDGICTVCGEEEVVEKKLMRIRVTTEPTKTQYEVGEVFDSTGMVVTASYNDSTTETVTDYEIDKKGALTADDTTITITWQGKSTALSIVVKSPLVLVKSAVVETADNAVYTIEAEDLDYSNCINSNDNSKGPNIEDPTSTDPVTSGGHCIGTLSVPGNTFGFSIESQVDCKATLVMRASATHVNIPVDDLMEFTLNGTVIKCGYTLTWAEGRWWGWEHASFENIDIKKGLNEIVIKCKGQNEPNIDCFYLIVNPTGEEELPAVIGSSEKVEELPDEGPTPVISSAEQKVYRVEAESLDYSDCSFMNGVEFSTDSIDSDTGTAVSNLSVQGNKFGFTVKNTTGSALPFVFAMRAASNWYDMALDDLITVTLNGERIITGGTLSWDGNWNVYHVVKKDGYSLKSGENVIQIEVTGGACPNIDYFEILIGEEKADADVVISSSEQKSYRVEAESLDYSSCGWMNGADSLQTDSIDDNTGTAVSNFSVQGNKVGFTVRNDTGSDLPFVLAMRVAANWADMPLDQYINIKLNGRILFTGLTALWDGNWNVYKVLEKGGLTLVPGTNTIQIEVRSLCPNLDYFEIKVGAEANVEPNATVSSSEAKSYRVEAERLDYSDCVLSNGMKMLWTETNTDDGTSVVALSTQGNKFGFTVQNDTAESLTFTLVIRASANESDMVLDDLLKITLNGEEITTDGTLSWDGNWNVCHTVEVSGLTLATGLNEIQIEVIQGACPNIDYFEIVIG